MSIYFKKKSLRLQRLQLLGLIPFLLLICPLQLLQRKDLAPHKIFILQVAKTSQGLVPQSFCISFNVKNEPIYEWLSSPERNLIVFF